MTLPPSGNPLSFYDINIELRGSGSATNQIGLDEAESDGYQPINKCASPFPSTDRPASVSEWYSYNHAAASTIVSASGFDYSATNCTTACNLVTVCDDEMYYNAALTSVYNNSTCTTARATGYWADCSRINCVTVGSNGLVTSITACNNTTTTTTTTTLATGTCYKVLNGNNIEPTLDWTSVTGQASSGSVALNGEYYICSIVTPSERGGPAELSISACPNATVCTNNCTSLGCKQCASSGTC